MARRGVMNALQAALAGIGGAAGGYVQQQELERKRKAEEDARKRQEMLDVVGLQERGFMSPEQLARQQMQGKRTTGAVVQNALLSALSPRAGVLPPPTAQDVGAASQALATAGMEPQRVRTVGGTEMVRAETPFQREERLGVLEREQKRMETLDERRARQQESEAARKAQAERDKAERDFEAQQRRLDREARLAEAAIRTGGTAAAQRPTEAQEKSFFYYDLMENANKELNTLSQNERIRPWAITTYLNTPGAQFGRFALNDEEKQFIRAAQDFAAGVYRKESGAAVNKSELAATLERYIEMGGEEEGSRKAKVDARNRITNTMGIAATPALRYYGLPTPLSQDETMRRAGESIVDYNARMARRK